MRIINTDVAIIGAGGAGLRAAIAAAESDADIDITLISKVYPMRSHTVAAEGGAAAVIKSEDSFDLHFQDTVLGGDWLCDQNVVDYFVQHAPAELAQLERWGCPWSRKKNGDVNVRPFGGMQVERTWFAADKTGFHLLHTLFQTSLKYQNIQRLDEFFVLDLLVNHNQVTGLVALDMMEGKLVQINAKSVIIATGGAGRVYQYNTNGNIVTGDGMAMAYKHGVPLRDMEFIQFHPTGLAGSGILMTEGCRGEGGILINKHGQRYLQYYDLGPETPLGQPKNGYMELGSRDRLSQAFWHESQKGNTLETSKGDVVYLDLRHLGKAKINQRLPFIRELAKAYAGVDPIDAPIPVRPTAHYTMGGIETNRDCETRLKGLYAVGECASIGLHGANRLGSNSLSEIMVFGRIAGEQALKFSRSCSVNFTDNPAQAKQISQQLEQLRMQQQGSESWAQIRHAMGQAMEQGCGIYRTQVGMQQTLDKLTELKQRIKQVKVSDCSFVYNTELLLILELQQSLLVAESIIVSALARQESRGSHQRLDYHFRDDHNYLKHTLAFYQQDTSPKIDYEAVKITKLAVEVR